MLSDTRQPCDEAVVRSQAEVTDCGQAAGRWVLAAAILGSSITFIDGTVVNVVLPMLQRELGASVAEAQWIVESYALMLAAYRLADGLHVSRSKIHWIIWPCCLLSRVFRRGRNPCRSCVVSGLAPGHY
ncbi:MAG: hypothetical protein ACREXS_07175 [Gammaproteobacteria bacterium]